MKTLLLSVLALAATLSTFSQTTLKDYLYVTSGYKDDISKGKNPSSDYLFQPVTQATTQSGEAKDTTSDKRTCKLLAVYRNTANQGTIAAYMVEYRKGNGERQYFCIPAPNSSTEVTQAYFNSLYDGDPKINPTAKLQAICLLLSRGLKW
jgi:hypothetical protein